MAKSVLSADSMPKAGRVNEVCREWLVHEDSALAYRLQDEEIKEHYSGNKNRNAQVREDLPRARIEQELEEIRYHSIVQEREERDEMVARQVALNLEREERLRERELQERMRLQLRLDDRAAQIEAQAEMQRRIQEEKDQELAKKLQQEEEENCVDANDGPGCEDQLSLDRKMAMEAQDAELARMLQDKERAKARRARERARQKKLERQQQMQRLESHGTLVERPSRPDRLELKSSNSQERRDTDEIQVLEVDVEVVEENEDLRELPNVATMIDPTYAHRTDRGSSSNAISPNYATPSPPQDLIIEEAPCYMPIQGQRRAHMQSPSLSHEEKQKRRVKDGCKQQ